ncbi:hypothetical protein ACFONG_15910 [Uliginosibacterium paludis]|uniref:Uncharacterized protein n=1 Tax=Uliginosibacterium paludis TaxID=1615952 RepID=A0ABV2CUJ1_9RHOO
MAEAFEVHSAARTPTSYLTLLLDNATTYLVKVTVSYFANGEEHIQEVSVSGRRTFTIHAISMSAEDLTIDLDFVMGASHSLKIAAPRAAWRTGQGHLKLTGVWPGNNDAQWIE